MVRANLIQNGVSVNMYGYNEEIGIGDYVIIVTENKEKSKLEKKVTKKRIKEKNVFKFFRIFYILLIYFSYSQSSYELYNTKEKSL